MHQYGTCGLSERLALKVDGRRSGFYHAAPGYETYKGLGWLGVIVNAGVAALLRVRAKQSKPRFYDDDSPQDHILRTWH